MSLPADSPSPLDLSKWRKAPIILIVVGGVLALIAALAQPAQFRYSWLLAFMFYLSICLGGLFLTIMHHLFDASWSVPIRRITEHIGCLSSVMAVLFIPIALFAKNLYRWMHMASLGQSDHALAAKHPLFTAPGFYIVSVICLGCWIFISRGLRKWSLRQDETGAAQCTFAMRRYAAVGIFVFAFTLTLAVIMWMKSLQHQWFSTMYGVYYFAGSVWLTLATVYLIAALLGRQGPLRGLVNYNQFYFLGSLLLAFTVFYAYIHFSQYFIIWNGNMPEETFWYVLRERGSWRDIGLIIIFGHFFIPFLTLLRIDVKLSLTIMAPLCLWAWLMHFCDIAFNIIPVRSPAGFTLTWTDVACFAFMGGLLSFFFIRSLFAHPIYPLKDPRLREALGLTPAALPPATAPTNVKL